MLKNNLVMFWTIFHHLGLKIFFSGQIFFYEQDPRILWAEIFKDPIEMRFGMRVNMNIIVPPTNLQISNTSSGREKSECKLVL